jgi:uncharacterized lipoprotein YajG
MINFRSLLAILITFTLIACNAQTSNKINTYPPQNSNRINSDGKQQIIDVRTADEYSKGFIKNAKKHQLVSDI